MSRRVGVCPKKQFHRVHGNTVVYSCLLLCPEWDQDLIPTYPETVRSILEVVSLKVTAEDITAARNAWMMIVHDTSPAYTLMIRQLEENGQGEVHGRESCICWFYRLFYERLFDMHPLARQMFKSGMHDQGKFLVMMISTCLRQLNQPETFRKSMTRLAHAHCMKGVKPNEYGIVGDVLFWTLRKCLSPAVYDFELERVWIKVYSSMLTVIVPYAVDFEMNNKNKMTVERVYDTMRGERKQIDKNITCMYDDLGRTTAHDTECQWHMSSFRSNGDNATEPPTDNNGRRSPLSEDDDA